MEIDENDENKVTPQSYESNEMRTMSGIYEDNENEAIPEMYDNDEARIIPEIREDDEAKEIREDDEAKEIREANDSTRRRTMLSIEQKAEICYKLDSGVSVGTIANEYRIHPTTVRGIRRNGTKVRELANQGFRMLKKKRLRKPEFEDLEDRLHDWILARRKLGEPLSDSLLHKKALEINEQFGGPSSFKASVGWLVKFKHRRDISLSEKKERAKAEARKRSTAEFEFFDCHKPDRLSEASGLRNVKEEPIDYGYERQESNEGRNERTEPREEYKQEEARNGSLGKGEPREPCKEEERRRGLGEREMLEEQQSGKEEPKDGQCGEKEERDREKYDGNASQNEIRHALEILTKHAVGAPRFIKSTLENLKDFFLGGET